MGRIVRPVRIRPEKPLPPLSVATPSASMTGKKDNKKKRKREKLKLVRARRRTIDPTKWDSQHLKGAFLDSIVVADEGDDMPVTAPSQPDTVGDQEESDLLSEEEEGDESDSSEPESVVRESPSTPKGTNRPPLLVHTKGDTVETDNDFNQEKLRALSLLDSMFGGLEGDQEWGGKETLDSDIDMPEPPPAQISPSPKLTPSKEASEEPHPEPAVEAWGDSESEESSVEALIRMPEHAPTSVAIQNTNTKARLKDLFAPQEEQGAPPLAIFLL
jgi:hypothetical protein